VPPHLGSNAGHCRACDFFKSDVANGRVFFSPALSTSTPNTLSLSTQAEEDTAPPAAEAAVDKEEAPLAAAPAPAPVVVEVAPIVLEAAPPAPAPEPGLPKEPTPPPKEPMPPPKEPTPPPKEPTPPPKESTPPPKEPTPPPKEPTPPPKEPTPPPPPHAPVVVEDEEEPSIPPPSLKRTASLPAAEDAPPAKEARLEEEAPVDEGDEGEEEAEQDTTLAAEGVVVEAAPAAVEVEDPAVEVAAVTAAPLEAPSAAVRVDNLVRPFTEDAARALLASYGPLVSLWMPSVKTHAYAVYEHASAAASAVAGLSGIEWPAGAHNALRPALVPEAEAESVIAAAAEAAAAAGPTAPPPPEHVTAVSAGPGLDWNAAPPAAEF
jgi:hypothetical protein